MRALRWPLALLAVAGLLILVAVLLDNEMSLTIGAPALTVLLPLAVLWLAVAFVLYLVRRRREGR